MINSDFWNELLTENDKKVIEKGGYGKQRGLGEKAMLMIIDAQYNYLGADKPVVEQLSQWPSGVGERAWRGVDKTAGLLAVAREKKIPVLYTRNVQKNISFDSFSNKTNRDQSKYIDGHKGTMIVDELKPLDNEYVLDKAYASAFYGTPLLSWLVKLGIDSLVIVGGSTSGCVRASAIDAVSRNFKVAVVSDCVFDRIELSHKVSLLDLWMKYCDLINQKEAIDYINRLEG